MLNQRVIDLTVELQRERISGGSSVGGGGDRYSLGYDDSASSSPKREREKESYVASPSTSSFGGRTHYRYE